MAHNINFNEETGQHSFFSVKEKAWHNLGQIVSDYPTSSEAIKYAGLDFEVIKAPNLHRFPDGGIKVSANSFFTYRLDNHEVLGDKLGNEYEVVQNRDAFSFFDSIVDGKEGILYETAGALGKGERIFITAKLPDYIRVGYDDLIEKYLFLTTSHDGSGSITAAFTPVRIVCNNTLNAAIANMSNCIKIRHTQSAQDKLKQAHKVMGISNCLATELTDIFNQWAKVRISDKQVLKLVQKAMAPSKEVLQNVLAGKEDEHSTYFNNVCQNICEYAFTSPSQQTVTTKGTLFGAYNAITGYFQNVKEYKNKESKLKSVHFGTGLTKTQTAFKLCIEFTKGKVYSN